MHLPHTVRLEPENCSGGINYRGICWYRKRFFIEVDCENEKLFVEFEGAKHVAEVFVNGKLVFVHEGGYLPFTVDITDFIIKTQNIIAIRLDNTDKEDIPPGKPQDELDFCYFGGLYRNVWLHKISRIHITDAVYANKVAGGGIFVQYENVSKEQVDINISTHIINEYTIEKTITVLTQIIDKNGICKATQENKISIGSQQDYTLKSTINLKNPKLWNNKTPYLYTLSITLIENENLMDTKKILVGIRHIVFDSEGFKINGEHLKLSGANRHQEYIYIGDAVSDYLHKRDAVKLKEAGFNFIRTGHYPPGEAFINACDELGLMCAIPIPGWQWFRDNDLFKQHSYQTVRDMIRKYRNHPSIIFWEPILNETPYTVEFAKTTYKITHEEYPGDQCYAACDAYQSWGENYDIPYGNSKANVDKNKSFFIREYGDNYREQFGPQKTCKRCSRGVNSFYPGGEKAMLKSALERAVQLHRAYCNTQLAGCSLWTGIDCNRGYVNNIAKTGVLDLYRLPKFSYYLYKSQREDEAVVFIANYWNENTLKPVVVFSNCEEIKLYLNNKLIAVQSSSSSYLDREDVRQNASHFQDSIINEMPESITNNNLKGLPHPPFVFEDIPFEKGILKAEGIINGKVTATYTVSTQQKPKYIELKVDDNGVDFVADGSDCIMIHAFIKDENGMTVTDNYTPISFEVEGNAHIIGNKDAKLKANPVIAEAGATGILLQAGTVVSKIIVHAYAENLESATINIPIQKDNRIYIKGFEEIPPTQIPIYEADKIIRVKKTVFSEFDRAAHKQVYTSSYQDKNIGNNIVDNNLETKWIAATKENEWLIIDLEQDYNLTGCRIWWESDNTHYDYSILVSQDNQNWSEILRRVGTGQDIKPDVFNINKIRYIKIFVHSVSKDYPSIFTVQVFGI